MLNILSNSLLQYSCNRHSVPCGNITIFPNYHTLANFTGKLYNGKSDLFWTASSEINMNHYQVKRSNDGRNFTAITKLMARGNSTINTLYSYTDNVSGLTTPVVYYRLKMVEHSGLSKYSSILSFTITRSFENSIGLYPNPANNYTQVKLNLNKEGLVAIKIIDAKGRIVYTENTRVNAGTNILNLNNLSKFSGGNYTLQAIADGKMLSTKLVIAR